jgi:hypothetical protein
LVENTSVVELRVLRLLSPAEDIVDPHQFQVGKTLESIRIDNFKFVRPVMAEAAGPEPGGQGLSDPDGQEHAEKTVSKHSGDTAEWSFRMAHVYISIVAG